MVNNIKNKLNIGMDFLLVDGMNLVFKVAYAMRGLTSGEENTQVVYGFLKSLTNSVKCYLPSGVILVWDGKNSKLRRQEIYLEYKANRKKDSGIDIESVFAQIDILHDFSDCMGMGWLQIDTYEADDCIASFTKGFPEKSTVIHTSDGDLLQLVNKNVKFYTSGSFGQPKEINHSNFVEKVGVTVDNFIDYKIIVGDGSDGIPGITGIGKKTAKLLLKNTDLETYMKVNTVTSAMPRTKHLFDEGVNEILERNRKLMDLNEFVIPPEDLLEEIRISEWDEDNLVDMLEDYSMFSILDNFADFKSGFQAMNLKGELNG